VRDRDDSASPIARRLIEARLHRDIALVVDPRVAGSNLKVANLENMLPKARHGVLVLADSDVRVEPHYLAAVTAPLHDPRTGLMTCLYKAAPTGGFWSLLGAMHINFSFLPNALLGEAIGTGGGCFGATIALRREVLERIGGFTRLRNELADDHRMGAAVRALGLSVVLSPYIVENRVTEPDFTSLWRHELRWARTSRAMAPAGFAGLVVTHTVGAHRARGDRERVFRGRLDRPTRFAGSALGVSRAHRAPAWVADKWVLAAAAAGRAVLRGVCG